MDDFFPEVKVNHTPHTHAAQPLPNTARDPRLDPDPATDHILGPMNAAVTIIEYGDFESPACAQAYEAVKIILRTFPTQVRFVFRHNPEVEIHPHAEAAAEAAEAVGAQGHFWPFHDLLFEHRDHLKPAALRQLADRVGADLNRYDHETQGRLYLQRVQENRSSAHALGVRAMPTFYVNGQLTDVSFGLEHLAQAVAQAAGARH
jgi:protein-disulfide isomerase